MDVTQTEQAIVDYLPLSPKSLVIRETCRLNAIQKVMKDYSGKEVKILDIGCGDGSWWKILSHGAKFNVDGIDISESEIEKAKSIINARKIDVTRTQELGPLRRDYDLAIGNCSLEHVPDIDAALKNINSLMAPDSLFVLFVPTPYWALKGNSVQFLNRISPRLSMMISGMINGFFQHWHLYHHSLWRHILSNNGFAVKEINGIGSERLEFLYRLYLPTAFVSFLVKALTGKYLNRYIAPLMPSGFYQAQARKLAPLVTSSMTTADDDNAFEYMIIARRKNSIGT